jgi:hypothetical protein
MIKLKTSIPTISKKEPQEQYQIEKKRVQQGVSPFGRMIDYFDITGLKKRSIIVCMHPPREE